MTFGFIPQHHPSELSPLIMESQEAVECRIPVGITSENVRHVKLARLIYESYITLLSFLTGLVPFPGSFRFQHLPPNTGYFRCRFLR
jgi:hypothetical protein